MFKKFSVNNLNRLLTILSIFVMLLWAWKWLGPGGSTIRARDSFAMSRVGLSVLDMLSISLLVVCAGYLIWRLLSYFFWHKYFKE